MTREFRWSRSWTTEKEATEAIDYVIDKVFGDGYGGITVKHDGTVPRILRERTGLNMKDSLKALQDVLNEEKRIQEKKKKTAEGLLTDIAELLKEVYNLSKYYLESTGDCPDINQEVSEILAHCEGVLTTIPDPDTKPKTPPKKKNKPSGKLSEIRQLALDIVKSGKDTEETAVKEMKRKKNIEDRFLKRAVRDLVKLKLVTEKDGKLSVV